MKGSPPTKLKAVLSPFRITRIFTMSSVFVIFAVLFGSSLAAQGPTPPIPASGQPICFTPPDRHPASSATSTCTTLLTNFPKQYTPPGTVFRWTSNVHEVGPNVIHLPKVDYRVDHNRTHACLMEILDEAGVGDSFPATEIPTYGQSILSKCFTQNKCGLIALPPNYTTALAVCGSYHRGNGSECVLPVTEDTSTAKNRRDLDINGFSHP